ncbi:MAG: helix-turn-helix transcriptional regulator [Phycisphaerales bacterium]|nr:helix-turn-helix transcriptional regulator [Phycisphaerales bacterium]
MSAASTKNNSRRRPTRKLTRGSPKVPGATWPRVVRDGITTHVLVPIDEYERLSAAAQNDATRESADRDATSGFVSASVFRTQLAVDRIIKARKKAGLTQVQLAAKIGVPQSMISRIERNPDRTTIRTIRKIAAALGVDVRALLQ